MDQQTQATHQPSGDLPRLDDEVLEKLFGEEHFQFDLREGTAFNTAQVRMIYLNSDIIKGIYQALNYEAGEAWKLILKNSGYLWGLRIYDSLNQQFRAANGHHLEQLSVADFVKFVEGYFSMHGWGKVKIHLDDAPHYGIIRVSMTHSLFAAVLHHVEDRVDAMIAGMLRGLFEKISGRELDCLEVTCACQEASPACEFVLTAPERIQIIEPLSDSGVGINAVLGQLRES